MSTGGPDGWLGLPLPELRVDDGPVSLRPWRVADAAALAAGWDDPDVRRWLRPPGGGVPVAETWIAGVGERLAAGTAIDAAIVVDDAVVGEIGLHRFDRRRRAALVGYWVGAGHRGRRLASVALAATTRWWFDEVGGDSLLAECATDNAGSWRTAELAGFRLLDERDGRRVLAIGRAGLADPAGAARPERP